MDSLKAEIASKRKALDNAPPRATKYMRRGEIERMKEEEERKAREEAVKKAAEAEAAESLALPKVRSTTPLRKYTQNDIYRDVAGAQNIESSRSTSLTPALPSVSASPAPEGDHPPGGGTPPPNTNVAFNISNEETIRRLRAKGQPIRLFGESDKDRRLRLRALELIEEKGHERVGGQDDFRKALEDVESAERLMRDRNANSTAGDEDKGKKKDDSAASGESEIAVLDLALIKSDPDKLYPVIYYALKRILKEWGESMAERPGKTLTHSIGLSFVPSLTRTQST